jgi:hypothetical protein
LGFTFKDVVMKFLIALLILPLFSASQTVHVKEDIILYEGKEKVIGVSAAQIDKRIPDILRSLVDNFKVEKQSADKVRGRGQLKLKTPYNIIRTVDYSIELRGMQDGYEYLIDSVSFTEQKRGEKSVTKSSKEVLENMGEQGAIVGETERLLNETDMRFQRLLAMLKAGMGKN